MNNPDLIFENLVTVFWVKNTEMIWCKSGILSTLDPGKPRIRDPGSGINIPDPQHWRWHNCSSWYLLIVLFCYFLLFYLRPVSPNLDPCWHNCSTWYLFTVPSCFLFIFRPVSPDPVCGAGTHARVDICLPFYLGFYFQANITWPCMWCWHTCSCFYLLTVPSCFYFYFQASITWPCMWCWHTCSCWYLLTVPSCFFIFSGQYHLTLYVVLAHILVLIFAYRSIFVFLFSGQYHLTWTCDDTVVRLDICLPSYLVIFYCFIFRPVSPDLYPCWHNCSSWYLLTVSSCCFILGQYHLIWTRADTVARRDICLPFHLVLFSGQYHLIWTRADTISRLMIFAYCSILFFIFRPISPDPVCGASTTARLDICLPFHLVIFYYFIFRPISPDPVCGAGTHARVDICLLFHLVFLCSGQYHLTLYVVLAHMLVLIFAYRSILLFFFQANIT